MDDGSRDPPSAASFASSASSPERRRGCCEAHDSRSTSYENAECSHSGPCEPWEPYHLFALPDPESDEILRHKLDVPHVYEVLEKMRDDRELLAWLFYKLARHLVEREFTKVDHSAVTRRVLELLAREDASFMSRLLAVAVASSGMQTPRLLDPASPGILKINDEIIADVRKYSGKSFACVFCEGDILLDDGNDMIFPCSHMYHDKCMPPPPFESSSSSGNSCPKCKNKKLDSEKKN